MKKKRNKKFSRRSKILRKKLKIKKRKKRKQKLIQNLQNGQQYLLI